MRAVASEVAALKTATGVRFADYYIFTQVLFCLLIGAMVFILPNVSAVGPDEVPGSALRSCLSSVRSMVVATFPAFRAADHAVDNIQRLENALDRMQRAASERDSTDGPVSPPPFETIELRGATFSYRDGEGNPIFTAGPIDFTLKRGETVLFVGGNGSGKSTVLKLLTGLYYPDTGAVLIDGIDVRNIGYRNYRECFQ